MHLYSVMVIVASVSPGYSDLKCKFTPEWLCLSMEKVWLAYKSADVYCLYGKNRIFSIHGEVFR